MAVKKRRLGMHEKLLFDTIKRQAGTLEKANTEGVMNSIEAGASKVDITLVAEGDTAIMEISDDGRGIQNEQEIIDFFETFGTPHGENECTTWKQFRMGRGQMFAFGKNTWRTATFRMVVDIKNWGLEYEFEDGLPFVDGCHITIDLYKNPIGKYPYYSMEDYQEAIQQQVRFVEIPVLFNGSQINTPPSDCNWDKADADAYYLFNVGTDLLIYNLGVFVMKMPASKKGMAGIVVSRRQLLVNFARNDVMSDCPVWVHIDTVIDDNRIKKTRNTRRTLDTFEKQAALTDLRNGRQDYDDIKTLALIPTAQGKHVSLEYIRRNRQPWCFAEVGSDIADRMMEREQALCIDDAILHRINYPGEPAKFFSWLTGNNHRYSNSNDDWAMVESLYADFDVLTEGASDEYCTLPHKKMTVVERRIIKVLNGFGCWHGRVINLGYSDRANTWTDGHSYITIDRSFLKRLYLSSPTHVNKLMWVLAHEMAHDTDSRGTHYHGPEFYENQVAIMGSNDSPTIYNATFYEKMQQSRIEEKKAKQAAKEAKAAEKVEKKLGIAASTK